MTCWKLSGQGYDDVGPVSVAMAVSSGTAPMTESELAGERIVAEDDCLREGGRGETARFAYTRGASSA